jgi:hypothetical protein
LIFCLVFFAVDIIDSTMCTTISLAKWVQCCKRLFAGLHSGIETTNVVSRDVTVWNSIDLRLVHQDLYNCKAKFEGIGISNFRGQSYPYSIDVDINGYDIVLTKTHRMNAIKYRVHMKDYGLKIVSENRAQRAVGII